MMCFVVLITMFWDDELDELKFLSITMGSRVVLVSVRPLVSYFVIGCIPLMICFML